MAAATAFPRKPKRAKGIFWRRNTVRINYVAIVVAAILYFLLGGLWFGKLFSNQWMALEGFKAVTSVYSVVEGEFLGVGDGLRADVTALESDPYGEGWLYRGRGVAEPANVDVQGYVTILDATIDKMLGKRHESK